MKKLNIILFAIIFIFISVSGICLDITSDEMLELAEKKLFPENYYMKITITTVRPNKPDKSMTLENYYKRISGTFMEILSPARSRGIRFLQKEEGLWMFNPKSNSRNAIRLSLKESFQGSVFSNNDVGDPEYSDDYTTVLAENTEIISHPDLGNTECYVLICNASHRESAYAKIVMWCTKDDYIPIKMEYYAKSGLLFRRMELSGLKDIAGCVRPTIMLMRSMEESETYSKAIIEELEIRNDLADSLFTQSALTR